MLHLPSPLVRLPVSIDLHACLTEVEALVATGPWLGHPSGFEGNGALLLISHRGAPRDDRIRGPFAETLALRGSPALRHLLHLLGCTLGRTRLMMLAPGARVPPHVDVHPYWRSHLRLHLPLLTEPQALVRCGDQVVHMGQGEVWALDTFRPHEVRHGGSQPRIHLVCDVVGSARLARLLARAASPADERWKPVQTSEALRVEQTSPSPECTPAELDLNLAPLAHLPDAPLGQLVRDFRADWRDSWAAQPGTTAGRLRRTRLAAQFDCRLEEHEGANRLSNGMEAVQFLREGVLAHLFPTPPQQTELLEPHRPVFVVCPPRSGSSMLFEALARSPEAWTVGGESHAITEGIPGLSPADRGWQSNVLTADQLTPAVRQQWLVRLSLRLRDAAGRSPGAVESPLRVIEKTPKNALRVAFLRAACPDAHFVVLVREPRAVMSSMIEGWLSRRFVTYPELPGWTGAPWSFLLTEGWRELVGAPLERVVAHQWSSTVQRLLDDLDGLPLERLHVLRTESLVADPRATLEPLLAALELAPPATPFGDRLPLARHTVSPPMPHKWHRHRELLAAVEPLVADAAARLDAFACAHAPDRR